jgi:CheY-like chemotaxis protein
LSAVESVCVSSSGKACRSTGMRCRTSPDGETALSQLKRRHVDVVIANTDLMGMSGLQLSRTVVRIHPHIPVVMMTPQPEAGLVAQALSSGASDLVSQMTTSGRDAYGHPAQHRAQGSGSTSHPDRPCGRTVQDHPRTRCSHRCQVTACSQALEAV